MLKPKQNETERLQGENKIKRSFETSISSEESSALGFFESSLVCETLHHPMTGLLLLLVLDLGLLVCLFICLFQDTKVLNISIRVFDLI